MWEIGYNLAYTVDTDEILAPVRGFCGLEYNGFIQNLANTNPCCHGNEILRILALDQQ